jgi:predicted nucleotidyltransferase
MDTKTIINILRENKSGILKNFGLKNFGIFGSYAVGNQTNKSDIDILVFPEENTLFSFRKKLELESLIQTLTNVEKVDLVNSRYINPIIKLQAMKNLIYV